MIAAITIFVITYLVIATEKVDKTAAALLGAALAVSTGVVPYEVALHAVDLNVVLLLVGMMLAVNVLASTGVFEWAAISVAKRAGGDGRKILLLLLALTAFLSAFLDNVTTVILVAPITILLCELLVLPVVPFLVLEALASNIGGTSTLVGDPPNVLIASKTGMGFNTFLINLGPPVLVMAAVGLVAVHLILGPRYEVSPALRQRVASAQPTRAILHPQRLRRALVVFALIMVGFFASHALGLEPGVIAIAGGLIMAVATGVDLHHALEKVEWNSVLFFIGLFMMIGALEHHEVFTQLGLQMIEWTGGNFVATALLVLWFSAVASAVVDNIPWSSPCCRCCRRWCPSLAPRWASPTTRRRSSCRCASPCTGAWRSAPASAATARWWAPRPTWSSRRSARATSTRSASWRLRSTGCRRCSAPWWWPRGGCTCGTCTSGDGPAARRPRR
jgi:Na+/H+ antiporter NhaD/arsenite permease-like protein